MEDYRISKTVFLTFIFISTSYCLAMQLVVTDSVIDVRNEPEKTRRGLKIPNTSKDNPKQLSQALFGEPLVCSDKSTVEGWLKGTMLEQKIFFHDQGGWQALKGFIETHQVVDVKDFLQSNAVVTQEGTSATN